MNELREKWLHDLETTEVPQIKGQLADGVGFCCLGRLKICAGMKISESSSSNGWGELTPDIVSKVGLRSDSGEFLVSKLVKKDRVLVGEVRRTQGSLVVLNDHLGMTFKQIAAFIRRNEKAVFKQQKRT